MSETLGPASGGAAGLTPPQSLDAERAILAAMMLDQSAIGRAVESIEANAFYRTAHAKMFEALVALYNRNEAADLVTVAEELRKRGDFEAIGGNAALAGVMEAATTTANLEHHVKIVHSKSILRQLIKATNEIQQQCYSGQDETAMLLDQAEARIFAITDSRIRQGFASIRDLLKPTFDHIQKLFERKVQVTGVPSGWDDLDKLTSGWQPGDLIILAGRPSMGKCVSWRTPVVDPATGERLTIEECVQRRMPTVLGIDEHGLVRSTPVGDWIDSGVQPCWKVRTRLGREIEVTSHHPFLTVDGWQPLHDLAVGDRVGVTRIVPVAGGDKPWRVELKASEKPHSSRAITRERLERYATALADPELAFVASEDLCWDEIIEIESVGPMQVYDLNVPDGANFIAADMCVHNTSAVMNMAENAAIRGGVPVAVFSLEMSKEQLALRLLCSQSEVPLHKVRTGFLGNEDWPRLTTGAGLLTGAPIYIDDSAAQSVLEIRAKCRRLKSENRLGLVVIDYLQLMRPSGPVENRVQEISQITRGLKALAKELSVPIIALSQLSRAVEQRGGGGRPQLSDLRDSGCLTADSRIWRADTGAEVTMGELLESGERDIPVWTMDDSYRLVQGRMTHVFSSGTKMTYEMRLASGRSIKASANHPFLTLDGWRRVDQLATGVRLATPRRAPVPGVSSIAAIHSVRAMGPGVALFEAVATDSSVATESDLFWDEITSIEPIGEQPVYDATVPGTHNFIANGIVAHNSIEQDADVVMFVYREVVYKPDTPEPGKAQIIVAKQRNGPTDDVDLTFLRECTKFVPYSPTMSGETDSGY